jgi:hypothetical protein
MLTLAIQLDLTTLPHRQARCERCTLRTVRWLADARDCGLSGRQRTATTSGSARYFIKNNDYLY